MFTQSATDRELNAVDSEYRKNISNESRAKTQIEKTHLAVPGSILNRFSTGNLETLKIPNLMEELQSFYQANYSSNLMNLVMVGRDGLDELQSYAENNFSEV
jgi:insulysin